MGKNEFIFSHVLWQSSASLSGCMSPLLCPLRLKSQLKGSKSLNPLGVDMITASSRRGLGNARLHALSAWRGLEAVEGYVGGQSGSRQCCVHQRHKPLSHPQSSSLSSSLVVPGRSTFHQGHRHGQWELALETFGAMLHSFGRPDAITFTSVINACKKLGTL